MLWTHIVVFYEEFVIIRCRHNRVIRQDATRVLCHSGTGLKLTLFHVNLSRWFTHGVNQVVTF